MHIENYLKKFESKAEKVVTFMGCEGSGTSHPVSPKNSKNVSINGISDITDTTTMGEVSYQDLIQAFSFLISDCQNFKCPAGAVPIACLNDNSFPLVVSSLSINPSSQTDVYMPVLAASIKSNGRIICYGHINMFNHDIFNSNHTAALIHNTLLWLNQKENLTDPIYFASFPKEYFAEIKSCFAPHGIRIQFVDFSPDLCKHCKYIMIPSYLNVDNKEIKKALKDLIIKGGGIGCIYIPSESTEVSDSIPINDFLIRYGLAFTYCSISEDTQPPLNVIIYESLDVTRKFTFFSLIQQFAELVHKESKDTIKLDDLVTVLRYNIMVSGANEMYRISLLIDLCHEYLHKTHYKLENNEICPYISQSIVVALLLDLQSKVPIDSVTISKEAELFPGLANVETEKIDINLTLQEESLISTGLWLQPGIRSEFRCQNELIHHSQLYIQVGAHYQSLVTKPGPWKRWPLTVSAFPIEHESTFFASPFGGIIYIATSILGNSKLSRGPSTSRVASSVSLLSNNLDSFKDASTSSNHIHSSLLQATVENVSRYPMAVYDNPDIWQQTKKLDVPWGELVSKSIIFTLPTSYLKKIEDFDKIFDRIELFINTLSTFMSYQVIRPYRIVFDVETLDDQPVPKYPIIMLENDINDILFDNDKPNPGLFRAMYMLALVSLRDGCFDQITELALAALVASCVFVKLFPSFDPLKNPLIEAPLLFSELWTIHTRINAKVIPELIVKSQNPETPVYEVPEDRWIAFVRDLCFDSKYNFSLILQDAHPIPLNLASQLKSLRNPPRIDS